MPIVIGFVCPDCEITLSTAFIFEELSNYLRVVNHCFNCDAKYELSGTPEEVFAKAPDTPHITFIELEKEPDA